MKAKLVIIADSNRAELQTWYLDFLYKGMSTFRCKAKSFSVTFIRINFIIFHYTATFEYWIRYFKIFRFFTIKIYFFEYKSAVILKWPLVQYDRYFKTFVILRKIN